MNPSGTQTYSPGITVPISATASSSYAFSSWTFNGNIEVDNAASTSTSAVINGPGTITANFISQTGNKLVFVDQTTPQTLLINQPSSVITLQRQTPSGDAYRPHSQLTVSLSSTDGLFYSDSACTNQIQSITIDSEYQQSKFLL